LKCFIVLPCFNEERNVKPLVHLIDQALASQVSYRIIAVNDGSHDRTAEVLKDLSVDYPIEILEHPTNLGLGSALKTGLLKAAEESREEDFVVVMDSDNTHDPKHILAMLTAGESANVIVGSRYVKGGAQLKVPFHRVILSKVINLLIRRMFQLDVRDATSGFRCFRASLLKRLRDTFRNRIIESQGFVASLELLLKAVYSGAVVAEVPILLDYERKGGKSKMRLFSTIASYLILLFRCRKLDDLKGLG
jgi:dolichol-phosphate mannosyltransferase